MATECHDGKCELFINLSEGEIMTIVTVGVDPAKNVFTVAWRLAPVPKIR
jgi:hypothetical protein